VEKVNSYDAAIGAVIVLVVVLVDTSVSLSLAERTALLYIRLLQSKGAPMTTTNSFDYHQSLDGIILRAHRNRR
jgi:hypothetical protein